MKTTDRTPFVVTHNPGNPPLAEWLKKCMPVLHSGSRMRKAAPSPPIVGERNCNNLRKTLTLTKPPTQKPHEPEQDKETEGCFKCTQKCIICKEHLKQTTSFSSVKTKKTFSIRDHLICSLNNIIYLIDCAKCGSVQYVGETGNSLQNRFYHHRSDIKTNKNTLVARHFNGSGHTLADLRCKKKTEKIKSLSPQTRKQKKRFWRHKLKTNYADGLNAWN